VLTFMGILMVNDTQKTIIASAATLRGAIITSYAQVENLLADIVLRSRLLPEYNALPKGLPYKLSTRIARVRQLVGMPGPLTKYKDEFTMIADELKRFEEIRHFMAHGLLIVRHRDDGTASLIYRMFRESKASGVEEGVLETNLDQLQGSAIKIGLYTARAVTLFRDVYRAHDLAPP
jgi:hypothetical protein